MAKASHADRVAIEVIRIVSRFLALSKQYPYDSFGGWWRIMQHALLLLLPETLFPKMSIVPLMAKQYALDSEEEFRVRYYMSRIGFEDLWHAQPRDTKANIEHFYQEHDKDIWRQAYLSKFGSRYKRKILHAFQVFRRALPDKTSPILDYGCGAGVLVHYLVKKGFKNVDAADIPSQTLDFVRERMSPMLRRVTVVDGTESFGKDTYAGIASLDCLEHTIDPLHIAERLLEALQPGGILLLSFPKETDFTLAHTRQAQEQRDAVWQRVTQECDVLVPELIYRKNK